MNIEKSIFAIVLIVVLTFAAITWQESRNDRARLESTIASQQLIISAAESREKDRDVTLKATLTEIAFEKRSTQTPQQILRAIQQLLHLPDPITLNAQSPTVTNPGKGSAPSGSKAHSPGANDASMSAARPDSTTESTSNSEFATPSHANPNSATTSAPISNSDSSSDSDLTSDLLQLSSSQAKPTMVPNSPKLSSSAPAGTSLSKAAPPQSATIPSSDLKPLFDYIQDCRACQAHLTAAEADLADEKSSNAALIRERDAAITANKGGSFWNRLKHNAKWLAAGAALAAAVTHLL